MSRVSTLVDRIEKLARKFGCSIEEVVDILEGKHPTHHVVEKPEPVAENPTPALPTTGPSAPSDSASSTAGTSDAPSAPDMGNVVSSANPVVGAATEATPPLMIPTGQA